ICAVCFFKFFRRLLRFSRRFFLCLLIYTQPYDGRRIHDCLIQLCIFFALGECLIQKLLYELFLLVRSKKSNRHTKADQKCCSYYRINILSFHKLSFLNRKPLFGAQDLTFSLFFLNMFPDIPVHHLTGSCPHQNPDQIDHSKISSKLQCFLHGIQPCLCSQCREDNSSRDPGQHRYEYKHPDLIPELGFSFLLVHSKTFQEDILPPDRKSTRLNSSHVSI